MPVPKRRQSSSRRDKRRTHDSLTNPTWSSCAKCGEPSKPHHACEKCGYYKGRKVLELKKA